MATNDESKLTAKQSSGTRSRIWRENTVLEKSIESILKSTEWPSESKKAARKLLNAVESSPNIPSSATTYSQDLIKRYIQMLESVEAQLQDAKSKAGMKRWKLLEGLKSIAPNRQNKCTLLFQTCQDDVSKVVISINEFLYNERGKEASGLSSEAQPRRTVPDAGRMPTPLSTIQTNPTEQIITFNDSTSGASQTQTPLLRGPEDERPRGPVRQEALNIVRKTCKAAEIASGSIPVAGNFLAAAAKVGLAFVETIQAGRVVRFSFRQILTRRPQTMDRNDDLAKDLAFQTDKLSKCLANFTKTPGADQGQEIASHVDGLQKELQRVHANVEGWKSLGRFNKAFHARDHGESLKGHQGSIQTAMEEMQLLVGLDTRSVVVELKNNEIQEKQRRLLKCLGDGKYGAQGNSIQDVTCFPGTRVQILEWIDDWIRDSSALDRVLWLRGMAGRGKSTIASTVVENWRCRASCAIFHFRRGRNTLNARIVCALARQLAGSLVPEVRNAVLGSVRENEDIADKRLGEQFKTLFVASLATLQNQSHPILIVVDGLDECDNPKDAVDFMRLIDEHSTSFPAKVKFLLTSRPEVQLLQTLEQMKWRSLDLDTAPDVSIDLERFIQQACQQIRRTNSNIPEVWPSPDDVSRLVEMSQGLFQWACTAITYMSSGSPVDRLRGLLRRPSAWSGLDDLYHQILSKAFDAFRLDAEREDLLHRVLGTLALAPYPISLEVIAGLYGDNEIFDGTVQADIVLFLRNDILADLNSLLFIPRSSTEPIRLMHTSIHDLLVSERRCKQLSYYINVIQHHQQLASTCFDIMLRDLRENICTLTDLSKPGSEVQDIAKHKVSRALLYCCRAWSIHLIEGVKWPIQNVNMIMEIIANLNVFSKEKLMCWLEVMSLARATKDAIMMAKNVYQWLPHGSNGILESNSLSSLWNDVQRFIATFSEPIQFGPLHIYVSALPHCPIETELGKLYRKHGKIRTIHGLQASTWPSNIWVRSVEERVKAVAFSPDGKVLASGSGDRTLQLWDAQTGTPIGEPLTGHGNWVNSVCFSPDGRFLASGSHDQTIRLWDTYTRMMIGEPLRGHSHWVNSVCFSPDGTVLASGSNDMKIRLWDAQTGAAVGEPLTGHSGWVNSVCFSPDGECLASGSDDKTVRFWNARTGTAIGDPLTGHSNWVNSVCFSPDGTLLASGSNDETIRLWDTQTRTVIGDILTGHSNWINSVSFSPDGKVLASGSYDQTIRLWDTHTRMMISEPLTGYSNYVNSVCFSPDGKHLVSGSNDKTIRLWDTQTGTVTSEPPTGYSNYINSVSLSPDGKLLASGSNEETIQLWNAETGTVIGTPLIGHGKSVNSVCFSPDGKVLASGSDDQTIRLWNTETGTAVGRPLAGHSNSVNSVCFSPTGKVLASGSDDNTIRLWDIETRTVIGKPLMGHSEWVTSVCFSPDGKVLASGSDDETIRLWNTDTGTAIGKPLIGRNDRVDAVCFLPDGVYLSARYPDGGCALWNAVTRQRRETPRSLSFQWNPAFQNHWIVFSSSRFFWLPPQFWTNRPPAIFLSCDTLAVLYDGNLSVFDVSRALDI